MARKKKEINDSSDQYDDLESFFKAQLSGQDLEDVEGYISTGSTLLDYAIANKENGGVPVSRILEIAGNEATGKSLLAYHILSNTQKQGGIAIYIDTERSGNKDFMRRMGINWEKLIYVRDLETIEDVFEYIEKVAMVTRQKIPDKKKPVVVVWDSVAGTPPKTALEADYDNSQPGIAARAMSAGLNKLKIALDDGWVTLVCINQLRLKLMSGPFSDPETTPHGKALPFYASVRVKLSGTKKLYENADKERTIGVLCRAKVIKNKVGPNWRSVNFPLMYDYGINDTQSILDYLKDIKVITTKGAWSTLKIGEEEHKFNSATWRKTYAKPEVKEYINKVIKENMIITFEGMPDDFEIDPESLMEVEQIKMDKEEKK
jgi:recombination protein RecA